MKIKEEIRSYKELLSKYILDLNPPKDITERHKLVEDLINAATQRADFVIHERQYYGGYYYSLLDIVAKVGNYNQVKKILDLHDKGYISNYKGSDLILFYIVGSKLLAKEKFTIIQKILDLAPNLVNVKDGNKHILQYLDDYRDASILELLNQRGAAITWVGGENNKEGSLITRYISNKNYYKFSEIVNKEYLQTLLKIYAEEKLDINKDLQIYSIINRNFNPLEKLNGEDLQYRNYLINSISALFKSGYNKYLEDNYSVGHYKLIVEFAYAQKKYELIGRLILSKASFVNTFIDPIMPYILKDATNANLIEGLITNNIKPFTNYLNKVVTSKKLVTKDSGILWDQKIKLVESFLKQEDLGILKIAVNFRPDPISLSEKKIFLVQKIRALLPEDARNKFEKTVTKEVTNNFIKDKFTDVVSQDSFKGLPVKRAEEFKILTKYTLLYLNFKANKPIFPLLSDAETQCDIAELGILSAENEADNFPVGFYTQESSHTQNNADGQLLIENTATSYEQPNSQYVYNLSPRISFAAATLTGSLFISPIIHYANDHFHGGNEQKSFYSYYADAWSTGAKEVCKTVGVVMLYGLIPDSLVPVNKMLISKVAVDWVFDGVDLSAEYASGVLFWFCNSQDAKNLFGGDMQTSLYSNYPFYTGLFVSSGNEVIKLTGNLLYAGYEALFSSGGEAA